MRKIAFLACLALNVSAQLAPAPVKVHPSSRKSQQVSDLPHHLVSSTGTLTQPSGRPARQIAESYLREIAPGYGLQLSDLAEIYIAREYVSAHNGVTHLVFRQQFNGVDVDNGEWTVNVDQSGAVLNAGGHFFPRPVSNLAPPDMQAGSIAMAAAMRAVNPSAGTTSYLPLSGAPSKQQKYARFSRGGLGQEVDGKAVWYAVTGKLRPAWIFFVPAEGTPDVFATVVDTSSQRIIRTDNLTKYQSLPPAKGLVFERKDPQPNAAGILSPTIPAYVQRTLQSFSGDATASPKGWVTGTQTVGNNVVAGFNPIGRTQLTNPEPATAPDRNFSFPLELGTGAANPVSFKEAAITNLFYWANRTHDLFYLAGFNEAAGNYQQENASGAGVGGDPMLAYAEFGSAAPVRATVDNAFYLTNRDGEDGSRSSINMFLAVSPDNELFTDGSYDAEVMVHEYTHGVSNRLVRQFRTAQGGAMSEAWSDYFSLEFTLPNGAPVDGAYPVAEYFTQSFGVGIRTRPYTTNIDTNPLTFAQLGRVLAQGPEVHADGEIWMEALWETRANLIKQLGETEARRRMSLLVLDGMKLSPPSPSMVDARDAILLADRVDFKGESQDQLWTAFAKRGLGVLAQSNSADSIHVTASFEKPSKAAALRFYEPAYNLGETVRLVMQDANNPNATALVQLTASSGDIENLVLRKKGEAYYGEIESFTDGYVVKGDGGLDLVPGDYISAYYVDGDTGSGSKLIQTTVPTKNEYVMTAQGAGSKVVSGTEKPLYSAPIGNRILLGNLRVTLPFAFPFFGQSYRTVNVSGDGLLSFDIPNFSQCNDAASFAATKAIAPLWLELAYGGLAQSAENVFYSSGNGSVTFRWAAETTQTGEPVNFSAVLYEDGRILFQYGDGNNDLVNTAQFGCSTNGPAVGISSGTETYARYYEQYDGTPYLEQAPSVLVEPPFGQSTDPVVLIETPSTGDTVKGVLTLSGIAYDPEVTIGRLDLLVDGIPRRAFSRTVSRTDFCADKAVIGCPRVGFSESLDLAAAGISTGKHTLQVLAVNSRGSMKKFPEVPLEFTVEPGQSRQPVGAIETPLDGADLKETTTIRGYVYAPDMLISAVDVVIDGVTYGRATYGLRRTDVCTGLATRPPNCPNAGFSFSLNSVSGQLLLPNGKHTLQIRALDQAGRYSLIPEQPLAITISNGPNQAPVGSLVSPAAQARLSGTVTISGFAYDPDGTVTNVLLLVDGSSYGALRYGGNRETECIALPNVAACPNLGFTLDFDTTALSNGPHSLGVLLRDNLGKTTLLPAATSIGMNVFVQN